jgi:hypothetical protein
VCAPGQNDYPWTEFSVPGDTHSDVLRAMPDYLPERLCHCGKSPVRFARCVKDMRSPEVLYLRLTTNQVQSVTHSAACPSVSKSSSCYTWTTRPVAPVCPGVTRCIEPTCVILQTQTLPPADPACPLTPVVTATPSCLPTCRHGCATVVTTVQAVATTV